MFAENRKISLRQLQAMLLLDFFGTAVLFLPGEMAKAGGRGCWLLAGVCGLVFAVLSLLLTFLGKKMPEGTAVEWCRTLLGPLFGNLVLLGLGAKLFCDGALELRIFSEIIRRTMLPATPVWVLTLVVLLIAGALAAQGMECRGRTAGILFFLVSVPLLVVLLAVAFSAEYGRVLPLEPPAAEGWKDAFASLGVLFQGLAFLYFIIPDLKKPQKMQRAVLAAGVHAALLFAALTFLSLAVYGEVMLKQKLLPTLQMLERVSFTGIFLTRQDVLLLWFWIASVSVFLSGTLFFSSLMGVRMAGQTEAKRKNWLYAALAVLFLLSFLPEDMAQAHEFRLRASLWLNGFYLLVLPALLLFLAAVRKKGGKAV